MGLALIASAQNNNPQNKKKAGGNKPAPQQHVQTAPTKFNKGTTFSGQKTTTTTFKGSKSTNFTPQSNVSGNAASTKFNKTAVHKNVNVTKNVTFQKQHFNLQTNKVVNKYRTVTFNKNYKIAGAYKWGPKYSVFVNYHPFWQPTWWWNWHYGSHIVFIYGGWYYWNAGYWYPAWGYAPDSVYYFDGPICASNPADDPAQIVANVQSALQQQGYYQGDIDGILGAQTRAALAEYQSTQGLEPTGLVDQPTLETLGMA
jgi:Putative peptidoglycan binding domain